MKYESTPPDKKISRLPTKTAAIYVRVSSKEQVDNYSIRTQLDEIRKYLSRNSIIEVACFVEEGESAKTDNRTQLNHLLNFVKKNKGKIDYVVVYKFDRWSRDVMYHHTTKQKLKECGTDLRSATEETDDTPTGRLIETMMSAIAQLDNEQKGARVKQAMITKALDGWLPTTCPVGYRNDKTTKRIVKDEPYFSHLQECFRRFLALYTITDLAAYLDSVGIKNRAGKPLPPKAVWHILNKSKFYAGKFNWGDYPHDIQGKHEPMITWEEHLQVQDKLHNKVRTTIKQDDPEQTFVLNFSLSRGKGFIHCDECGNRLTHGRSRGNGGIYNYYYCNNSNCKAEKKSIIKEELEDMFTDLLSDITPTEEYFELFNELLNEEWHKSNENKETAFEQAKQRANALREQKRGLIIMRARGEIDLEDYEPELERIKKEIAAAEMQQSDNEIDFAELEKLLQNSKHFLTNLEPEYKSFSVRKRREMAEVIFPQGLTYSDGKFRTTQKSELFTLFDILEAGNMEEFNMVTLRRIELRLPG